jgi:hypothetical protein
MVKYQITLEDALDHGTVVWEGESLEDGFAELNSLRKVGAEAYDMSVELERLIMDDNGDIDDYEYIDGIVWYESVEDWEVAHPWNEKEGVWENC